MSCYNKVQWDQSITAVTLVMSTENTYLTTRGRYMITRYCELHSPSNGRTYIRLLIKQNTLYVVCGIHRIQNGFNSSPPSATYMRQWTGSALVQIMAWRRIGWVIVIGPLGTNFNEILMKIQEFSLTKCIRKHRLRNGGHFVRGRWVKVIFCYRHATPSYYHHQAELLTGIEQIE